MRAERHAHEACRLRKIHVVELLLQLVGKQLGELVLEPLALLVRERQIARIGADPQHLGIDQLDREIEAALIVSLRARSIAAHASCGNGQRAKSAASDVERHVSSCAVFSSRARPRQNAMLTNPCVQQDIRCGGRVLRRNCRNSRAVQG